MTFEPGKLFKINEYFWLLFPTKETAAARPLPRAGHAADAAFADSASAVGWASYWSKQLDCTVSFISEGDTIMIVEVFDIQVKVINQEGKGGWINFPADKPWNKGTITEISNDI